MESISVSLAEGSATVSYDPSVTDPVTIAGEGQCVVSNGITCHLCCLESHRHKYLPPSPVCEGEVLLVLQVCDSSLFMFCWTRRSRAVNVKWRILKWCKTPLT